MLSITVTELPPATLLDSYRNQGAYTDCYQVEIPRLLSQADYVEAFYTTRLFKLERWILSWLVRRPSTDIEAGELALGSRDEFAAWSVEARTGDQLLLCDFQGSTRSWLMSLPLESGEGTWLYFGSAVVPKVDRRTGERRMSLPFRALLGFHKRYSRALLRAAAIRLASKSP